MIEIFGGRLLTLVNGATVGTSADPLLSGGNAQEALDNNLGKCKDMMKGEQAFLLKIKMALILENLN